MWCVGCGDVCVCEGVVYGMCGVGVQNLLALSLVQPF